MDIPQFGAIPFTKRSDGRIADPGVLAPHDDAATDDAATDDAADAATAAAADADELCTATEVAQFRKSQLQTGLFFSASREHD